MNEQRLSDYLEQMQRSAVDALNFVEGMDKDTFLVDKRTQQAVVMSLVIIGEAATKVMDRHTGFVEKYPTVPWRNMRGMRNRIAHGYFEIDFDVVWDTVHTALPDLLRQLSAIDRNTHT